MLVVELGTTRSISEKRELEVQRRTSRVQEVKQKSKVITRILCVIFLCWERRARKSVRKQKKILLINARSAPLLIKIKHPPPSQGASHVVCLQTNARTPAL